MALENDNDRLREELNRNFINGADDDNDQKDLVMINQGLHSQVKTL